MANSSVETDSETILSLLLLDINQPIELESKLFATDENKVSNFTSDSLESKTNTDEMKDVDSMFPQPAAVTLNKTRLEKQQVPTFKSNEDSWGKSLDNLSSFTINEIEQHRLNSGKTPENAIIKHWIREENLNVSVIYLLILYTQSGTINIFLLNVNAKQA